MEEKELDEKIHRFMRLIYKAKEKGELSLLIPFYQTDYQCIVYLSSHPNSHPSTIAEALKSTRPNIAANLRILEQKGYIERAVDPDNRRQVFVNLTEKGKNYYALCEKQVYMLFARFFDMLGEEDTEHLFEILKKVCDGPIKEIDLDENRENENAI